MSNYMYGVPGEWYQDDYIGGYYDSNGRLNVCFENGTDEDFDTHFEDVQNGNGYYDSCGKYRNYGSYDEWWL